MHCEANVVIILIGMPGSGKSSAGRHVARRFALPFIDTDQAIEEEIGMSIRTFFEAEGEEAFRNLETAMLRRLVEEGRPCVLSTGGGSVLRPENRALMRQGGTVLYLRATPDELFRRLRHDTKRPLLQVGNPRGKLQQMFKARDPQYRDAAHYVIETTRTPVQTLVNHIAMQLEMAGMAPQDEGDEPPEASPQRSEEGGSCSSPEHLQQAVR